MTLIDQLEQIWNSLIDVTSKLVIPDWGALVGLLPLFLLVLVLGPLLSLLALVWVIYFVIKPRAKLKVVEGPYPAPLDGAGRPVYPSAEPYCPRDALIYPWGDTRCDRCSEELVVTCPKCDIGRLARIDTCANCGLILKVARSSETRALRPTGPPPGGAAIA